MNNSIFSFYIKDFRRKNKQIKKYKIEKFYNFKFKLIYNQSNAFIKMRKKLILIGLNKFKAIDLPNDIINYTNNNMNNNFNNNINNMINNIMYN